MNTSSRSADLKRMRTFKWHSKVPAYVSHPNGVPIVEHKLLRLFSEQGFDLDTDRDNKSVVDVDQLFSSLARYHDESGIQRSDSLDQAISLAYSAFGGDGSLLPLTPEEAQSAVKLEKSSGLPELTSKRDALPKDFRRFQYFYRGNGRKQMPPCIAYHRVQHGETGPKTRLVWGYPLSVTLLESVFARPLIDKFLVMRTPMAFGLRRSDLMARTQGIENSNIRIGMDVSGFDASVKPYLIGVAFSILRTWFPEDEMIDKQWSLVQDYFIHTPILMPDGWVYRKHQGVPSGSYFTQLVDSIVNYILVQYSVIRARGESVNDRLILVLGDDSLIGMRDPIPLSDLVKYAKELGFTISLRKSEVSRFGEPYSFLGHHWDMGFPRRDLKELVKRSVYAERISGIPDGDVRRTTRLVGLSGDALEGSLLLKSYGFTPRQIFGSTLRMKLDRPLTGWQEQLSSHGDESVPLSPFDYLAASLYK